MAPEVTNSTKPSAYHQFRQRDGSSQAGRTRPFLDPNYAAVDERTVKDLLTFAREYGKELQYFGVVDGRVEAVSDWRDFLSADLDLDALVLFMQDPDALSDEQKRPFTRPHFALFLTFLHLLSYAQDQLNTLTERHLDFYYRQVLNMNKRAGTPDQVNVLVDIASTTDQLQLPKGTLLNAGTDSLGQDLTYRTDKDIVLTHAQVGQLSSVFAEKQITGIPDARKNHQGTKEEKIVKMFEMAFGYPDPGDEVPAYPNKQGTAFDYALLQKLATRVNFLDQELHMRFDELRQLMRLKTQRDNANAEWNKINIILQRAARTRLGDNKYKFSPQNHQDFDANLRDAIGNPNDFDRLFDGIPEVKTIYDAYDKRNRQDLKSQISTRIRDRLYLPIGTPTNNGFTNLMQTKMRIDNEWNEINRILAEAGKRKGTLANITTFPAPSALRIQDIFNWPSFSKRLVNENNGEGANPSKQIWQHLHADLQNFITTAANEEEITIDDEEKLDIVLALNEILFLPDFYQEASFASVTLSPAVQELLKLDRSTASSFEIQKLNRLLVEAAYADEIKQSPITISAPDEFLTNLQLAFGAFSFPENLQTVDAYFAALQEVEQFFFMTAENFAFVMYVVEKENTAVSENDKPSLREWNRVYDILATAHKEKVYAQRRQALQEVRETDGFGAMLNLALGLQSPSSNSENALNQLQELTSATDAQFLEDVQQRLSANQSISANDWAEVYRIAELAQRTQLPEPIALKEEWLNLYAAADATAVSVDLGIAADADNPRWRTFGQGQPIVAVGTPPPTEIGWALCSPLLALNEGERTITLTLGFEPDQFEQDEIAALFANDNEAPFRIELTTEKAWIEPDTMHITVGDYHKLSGVTKAGQDSLSAIQMRLTVAANIDPITPLPTEDAQISSEWPQLRLLLRQIWQEQNGQPNWGRYITHYQPFQNLILRQAHVQVAAAGLIPTQLQNDDATLAPNKPFEPFGLQANAGARFLLGHPELIEKRLDSLQFNLQWMGAPNNLKTHYANYGTTPAISSNQTFTAKIALVDDRVELPLANGGGVANYALFAKSDANNPYTISISNVPSAISNGRSGHTYLRANKRKTDNDLTAWNRYIQWELNAPGFQHDSYPSVAMQKSVALAAAISNQTVNDTNIASYQVNPPYTPKIKTLTFDYTASITIDMATYEPEKQVDQLCYLQPFGLNEVQPKGATQDYLFLPQFDFEGELYIGLTNLQTPQNLSLLFQMAEGSANPDLEPVPIQWSVLSDNQWLSLDDGNLLEDATRGLINSGIITFALDPIRPSTLLPADYYWLRAAIPRHSNSVCDTVAIHTQAISATFYDQNNALDHLDQPLAAETITELQAPLPDVTAVRQPYTSFGGKKAEQSETFYTRISERLRHKNRAITVWDYEHLILEQFPQIYKAKCLPTTADNPGLIEIIIIPNIKNKIPFNPFEPKGPTDLIVDIETFLADKIPPFASVKVKNAAFVSVKVRFGVRFLPGYNEGFYKQQLNEDINRFLSPWAYEEGADIVIGGRIYANVLINFIEERPYVDFVAEIKLFSSEDGETYKLALPSGTEGYWVETKRSDGVLVAAHQHEIDMIPESGYEEESFTGINYMKIELDFIVGE